MKSDDRSVYMQTQTHERARRTFSFGKTTIENSVQEHILRYKQHPPARNCKKLNKKIRIGQQS